MFGLGLATKIYIAVEAIDMRKGFEGLHGLVRDHLGTRSAERTFVLVHQ
jgi:transposase